MNEPIFVAPYFKNYLWGGRCLETNFHFNIPNGNVGEAWISSIYPERPTFIINGRFSGTSLKEFWEKYPTFFGDTLKERPPLLLVKILDAKENLAIQVHPDDNYALRKERSVGKAECWYILETDGNAKIYFGHIAKTREELRMMIQKNEWDKLLYSIPVKKGDFIYVPPGTIHALGKGILAIEIQQSSDITYRLFDFNRIDGNGEKRKLQISKAIEVIQFPHKDIPIIHTQYSQKNQIITLARNNYFDVYLWNIIDEMPLKAGNSYLIVVVISGQGTLFTNNKSYSLKKGNCFILLCGIKKWTIKGRLQLIACSNA